ncbi:hypothetical protein ARMGADRAFT_1039506 [Armillaria gallica]|uniref:Uncharacterized protein n=1 Tax=Armillaria gallica TaxID=47427 RepID=A0A2H3CYQ8_ARMGA|nr:hypothetical protein ARMGADRAFT_1039506 [Armillaria gallica]
MSKVTWGKETPWEEGIGCGIYAHKNKHDGKASMIHGHGIKTPEQEHNRNTNTGTTMHGNTTRAQTGTTQTQEMRTGQGRKGLVKQGKREKEAHDELEGLEGTAKDHELEDPENERSGETIGAKCKPKTSAGIESHHLQEMASACSVSQAYKTTKQSNQESIGIEVNHFEDKDVSKPVHGFLWKALQGTFKIGAFWE